MPQFPSWDRDTLPEPPVRKRRWANLIGPGLVMVGANIGGGEWVFGPLVTGRYGGQVLWLATLAILVQVAYNLSVMRYTLYTGESIFIGFFRLPPGLPWWPMFYMLFEIGGVWPYLSANAAVPLASVILGRLPETGDDTLVRGLGYGIFLCAFIPLIFGGKVYNALERVMTVKLVLALGYLSFVCLFFVSWETWGEILSGFFRFGSLPQEVDWSVLAAFMAVAGAGGLTNSTFSGYARDKGWGMGSLTGAIPSAVGGRTIKLSHTGKVFEVTPESLTTWRRWLRVINKDQFLLWLPGCLFGMALPAMFSYQYLRGNVGNISGNAVAAMTADALAQQYGPVFWFLTLLCGFLILAPTQVSQLDQIARRWTDVIWIGSRRMHAVEGHKVKLVYYSLLAVYCVWGLIALRLTPDPLVLAIATGVMWNFAFAFTSLHLLWVMLRLMPKDLRPGLLQCLGLVAGAILYAGISGIAFVQQWPAIRTFFGW